MKHFRQHRGVFLHVFGYLLYNVELFTDVFYPSECQVIPKKVYKLLVGLYVSISQLNRV